MARRVDANQREIVKCFRDQGASVQILSDLGKGCPDILVGIRGANFLFEIKDGKKAASAQKLTEHEQRFFDQWRGHVSLMKSVNEVDAFIESVK